MSAAGEGGSTAVSEEGHVSPEADGTDSAPPENGNGVEEVSSLKATHALQEEIHASRLRDLTTANNELKERVASLVADLEIRSRELDDSRRLCSTQSQEADESHQRATDDLKQIRQSMTTKEEAANKERDEWEAERCRFREQLAASQKDLRDQKSEHEKAIISACADLKAQLAKATGEKTAIEGQLSSLQEQVDSKEEERLAALAEKGRAERQMQQFRQDAEKAKSQVQALESEVQKWQTNYESVQTLLNDTQKQSEKGKDDIKGQYIKLSWAQNKLKAETDAHRETKARLLDTSKSLDTVRKEAEKLRKDYDKTVSDVQDRSLRSSTQLDSRIKDLEIDIKKKVEEVAVEHEAHAVTAKQLLEVQNQLKAKTAEAETLAATVEEKTIQTDDLQQTVTKEHDRYEEAQHECDRLNSRIAEIGELRQQLTQERERVSTLSAELSDVLASRSELEGEVGERQQKEGEMLSFHQRMAAMNAELQSQHTKLSDDVLALRKSSAEVRVERDRAVEERNRLKRELENLQQQYRTEVGSLSQKVDDKTTAVEQLTVLLEDERGEVRVLKKKNAASVKDLTRQLLQARKTVDGLKTGDLDLEDLRMQGSAMRGSNSHASVTASESDLSTAPVSTVPDMHTAGSPGSQDGRRSLPWEPAEAVSTQSHHVPRSASNSRMRSLSIGIDRNSHQSGSRTSSMMSLSPRSVSPEKEVALDNVISIARPPAAIEKERRMLLNKISSLQNAHAAKDDRMEFMDSHVTELTDEVRRKTKVIQCLVLRQDSGSISPASLDNYKLQAGPQRGIMASVFHKRRIDPKMTLSLSLEISSKMQAVLEDLLVKNMTLKDNLATLGQEVADLLTVIKQHNIRIPRKMR